MPTHLNGAADREQRLDEAIALYLESAESGQPPDRAEWLSRYPDLAAELSEFFADQEQVERWTGSLLSAARGTVGASPASTGSSASLRELPFAPGFQFADYEIVAPLGRGGMGVVYKARQKSLPRLVALKMIRGMHLAGPEERQRFRLEADAVARLDHPNIVPIYEVGECDGLPYFSMKLIAEGNLAADLSRFVTDPRGAARLVSQVARAVHHAHQRGILHRDLKPSNILLDAEGRPCVADFGLAKQMDAVADAGLTQSGAFIGSPAYMAPEQAIGKKSAITTATDVHGLGSLLYALLAGRPPFLGATPHEVLAKVEARDPEPLRGLNPRVERDLETICLKCLAKRPGQRYGSADAVAIELKRWLDGLPIEARPVGRLERLGRWSRRNPLVAGLSAATGLLVVATIVVLAVSTVWIIAEKKQAVEERDRAEESRALAEERENQMRRRLYVDDVKAAKDALRLEDRPLAVARLSHWLPEPGREDLRGFEWHLLWRLCHPSSAILRGHVGDVYHVAYSPDGQFLASAGKDGTVRLWDVARMREVRTFRGHKGEVNWVSISPNGKLLASCGDDGSTRLWDRDGGQEQAAWHAHDGEAVAVEFSPIGNLLASGGADRVVRLWNPDPRELTIPQRLFATLEKHPSRIESLAFSPRGLLAAGSKPGALRVWNVTGLDQRTTFTHPVCFERTELLNYRAVAFNHTGTALAVTLGDECVHLFDPVNGKPLKKMSCNKMLNGHAVAFSPDDRYLAASTLRDTIWITALAGTEEMRYTPANQGNVWSLAFSPDGGQLASAGADGSIRLWDQFEQGWKVLRFDLYSKDGCLRFSGDGKRLAAGNDQGRVAVWDVGRDQVRCGWRVLNYGNVRALAFHPDARTLSALAYSGGQMLFDTDRGREPATLGGGGGCGLEFSADGRTLLEAGHDGVRAWEMARLLPASYDDAKSRREVEELARWAELDLPRSNPSHIDNWLLATVPGGREILVLDTAKSELRCRDPATGEWNGPPRRLKYANITSFVCSGGVRRQVYYADTRGHVVAADLDSPDLSTTFDVVGHDSRVVYTLAISPDGRTLATSGSDETVRLWSTATGLEICSLDKPPGKVNSLTFSPDGKLLAGLSEGAGGIILWLAGEGSYKEHAPR